MRDITLPDSEKLRVRESLQKWKAMDATARLLGRGLGMKELLGRVAKDVGLSLRDVNSALKSPRD